MATRAEALTEYPCGTTVGRELMDQEGNIVLSRGRVCDFYDPYWRVEFSDGDWEELNRRELKGAVGMAGFLFKSKEDNAFRNLCMRQNGFRLEQLYMPVTSPFLTRTKHEVQAFENTARRKTHDNSRIENIHTSLLICLRISPKPAVSAPSK